MAFVPATPLVVHTNDANMVTVSDVVVTSLPANVVLISGSGNTLTVSNVTTTELGYLHGLTANIQDQINSIAVSGLTPNVVLVSNATGDLVTSNVTTTELGYLKGVTSNIQQQINTAGGTTFVGTPYDWVTNGTPLVATPLTFTPLPGRTYVVNAELGILANATDHTVTFGLQWPSPLYNANSGVVTALYQETSTNSVIKRSSAYQTPTWTFSTSTLANTLIMASLSTVFTTGSGTITPFSIVANTSNIDRYVYIVYGSHLTYRSFTNTPNFLPVITTPLQPVYTLSNNGSPTVISLTATDPEGSPVTWSYELVQGAIGNIATVTQTNNVFTVTPSNDEANAGTFMLRFGASDGSHTAYTTNAVFTLNSTAPVITTVLQSSYTFDYAATPVVLTLDAYDPEESDITWSYQVISGSITPTATLVQDGNVFTLTPSTLEANRGSFVLRFAVTDGVNTAYTPNITFTLPSSPPVITTVLQPSYTLSTTGTNITINVAATDPEGTALTYSYDVVSGSLGQIASVSQSGNSFTVIPSLGETYSGSFTLRFGVSDNVNATVYTSSAVFTKPSTAPTINSTLNASYTLATDGTPTTITVTATDPEGTPLTYNYEIVSGSLGSTATVTKNVNVFTITPSTNMSNGGSFQLRFSVTDGTNTTYTNGATFTLSFFTVATGGTVTDITDGGISYRVHSFTSVGSSTFTVSTLGVYNSCDYLIVAGGGGGGRNAGAGGGAGGLLLGTAALSVSPYSIVVGDGGLPDGTQRGFNGGNSSALGFTATGGGGGGTDNYAGASGGSGGGTGGDLNPGAYGTAGQGNRGGAGYADGAPRTGGGGGGRGGAGQDGNSSKGGDGGIGLATSIRTGSSVYYAGGGGGGSHYTSGGSGGAGGGGSSVTGQAGQAGQSNTGGGGGAGAGYGYSGGKGGSGIVVIRYFTSNPTALLLHMDGSNGSTTFTDSSPYARSITRSGTVQISTAQSKFGGASALFAAGDYIQAAASPELQFTGDFTIEMFVYTTSTNDQIIASSTADANTQLFRLNQSNATNTITMYSADGTQVFSSVGAGVTLLNTWRHLAMTRQSGSMRLFVDGSLRDTQTYAGTFRMDVIGRFFQNGSAYSGVYFTGYIDEVRVTNGYARYTANFTPPAAPFS